MNKYIIKNCPVCEFSDWEECTGYLAEGYICNDIHTEIVECQNRTDCPLKQIVERCINKMDTEFNSASVFAQDILDLFEIEECE